MYTLLVVEDDVELNQTVSEVLSDMRETDREEGTFDT